MTFDNDEPAKPENSNSDDGVPSAPPRAFEPDMDQAYRHVSLLGGDGTRYIFEAYHRAKLPAKHAFGTIYEVWKRICEWQREGYDVYVTMNAMQGDKRNTASVTEIRAFWHDWDTPGSLFPVFPLAPSYIIETSPGKFHSVWLLTGATPEGHAALMRRMVETYGSDKNATDRARVLRLAGTWNFKDPRAPVMAELRTSDLEPRIVHTFEVAAQHFPPVPRPERIIWKSGKRPGSAMVSPAECIWIKETLTEVSAEDREIWLHVGFALWHHFSGDFAGLDLWLEWSSKSDKFDIDYCADRWAGFEPAEGVEPRTIGTVYKLCNASRKADGKPPRLSWDKFEQRSRPSEGMEGFESMGGTPPAATLPPAPARKLLEFPSEISLNDIKERERGALVKGLVYSGQLGVLYGDPKAGKTFAALDLAWHVARGMAWHGIPVKRAPVLYVSLEGNDGFRKRQLAACIAHGDTGNHFARCVPNIILTNDDAGLAGVAEIVATVEALATASGEPVKFIIIDTMARALAGQNEDTTDAMSGFVEKRAGEIQRQTGAAVLIVHHTNKEGRMRGSQLLLGSVDVCFRVDLDAKTMVRTLILETAKDAEPRKILDYRLADIELGKDDDGAPITSAVVAPVAPVRSASTRGDMDVALKVIAESQKALSTTTNGSQGAGHLIGARLMEAQPALYPTMPQAKAAARAALAALEADGEIERFDGDGGKERWRICVQLVAMPTNDLLPKDNPDTPKMVR